MTPTCRPTYWSSLQWSIPSKKNLTTSSLDPPKITSKFIQIKPNIFYRRRYDRAQSSSEPLIAGAERVDALQVLGVTFVWKVLSGVAFVHTPYLLSQYICYNRKLNITLQFRFHMYEIFKV